MRKNITIFIIKCLKTITNDYSPLILFNDTLIFNDISKHQVTKLTSHNDIIIVIDNKGENRLLCVSINNGFYFIDLRTDKVFNEKQFDEFILVGVLYQINRRVK